MNEKIKNILLIIGLGIGCLIINPTLRSVMDPQMPSEELSNWNSMFIFFVFIGILSAILLGFLFQQKFKLEHQKYENAPGGSECDSMQVMH